jgi:hypothetical protein
MKATKWIERSKKKNSSSSSSKEKKVSSGQVHSKVQRIAGIF